MAERARPVRRDPVPKRRPPARRLVIMLKLPAMGRVKTRLAREIGAVAATRFARLCAAGVIRRLCRDPRWACTLAIAPDRAAALPLWPAGVARLPQGGGDLGSRMLRLMPPCPGPVVLIGADIPAVTADIVWRAFRGLGGNAAVFGPAEDGGFWLVGLNPLAARRGAFAGARWSTGFALDDALVNFEGRRVALATRLADVDDAGGYRRLGGLAGRLVLPRRPPDAQ